MCDRSQWNRMRERVSRLEARDAAQDEQIKTLFGSITELKTLSRYIMITALSVLALVMLISVLALVWCAVGPNGYQAVTNSAKEFSAKPIQVN